MIHLSGSLAFDRIMTFPGHFEEWVLCLRMVVTAIMS